MEVSALSQSLATQSLMGQLLVKVLGQNLEMAQQQALLAMESKLQESAMAPAVEIIEGLGENVDLSA